MKRMKPAIALLLFAAACTTACAPRTPGRTIPATNDSSGGSSQDTTIFRQSNTPSESGVQRISTTTRDSSGASSQDTTRAKY